MQCTAVCQNLRSKETFLFIQLLYQRSVARLNEIKEGCAESRGGCANSSSNTSARPSQLEEASFKNHYRRHGNLHHENPKSEG